MVDLGGYVIVLVETTDRRIRLYGSPADRADLEVGDEILEVNGRSLDDCTHTEVIAHIHQCIRSRTVCLRVRRRPRLVLDLSESSSNVQEAFVIAVEQQARERLERLSALQRIQPVDMTKLSQELNAEGAQGPQGGSNGLLLLASEASPVYVASVPQLQRLQRHDSLGETAGSDKSEAAAVAATANGHLGQTASYPDQELELTQDLPEEEPMSASPPVPTPRKSLSPSPGMKSPDGEPGALPAHREMAVDVPESFVAVAKTAPRYPPPPRPQGSPRLNGAAPTGEQLERIRKYQEEIRQRKEEEERIAQEQEFLRSSLRGSKKLRALAQGSEGILNDAFEADASFSTLPSDARLWTTSAPKPPTRTYNSRELEQCLERLEPLAEPGALGPVAALLREPGFQGALVVSNGVQEAWCYQRPPTPTCSHAQELAQEVLSLLQGCPLPEAAQLQDLLTRLEVEGLLLSHDRIAARCGAGPRWAHSPPGTGGAHEALDRAAHYSEDSIKIVHIDKTNEPLGATVRNEGESVIIGRIVKGGAAEKSGLLHEGDEVLEVNGIGMRGKSVNEVCDLLATMTGTLTFLIVPCGHEVIAPRSTDTGMIHVKAHFDYEPEEDPYIPCRELGIPFQKGDVLHVINRDDPNWWQAYRQGEEDQTLAGLIPSKSFQQQREAMKQALAGGDAATKEKTKRAAKFLCAKKHHKKKKKKTSGTPGLITGDEPETGEPVPTYEEVSLFYPRPNCKRPVVLVGPSNIGRHELRQKLMEDTERFAAAVPHTSRPRKDSELDGLDYHFISRPQFEADILAGKFVEHGEYERNYYGTSLGAIRSVVGSGKVCVLNLHPQSLKMLKHSDLKPYVVFVAPPSLEKLRQHRMRQGVPVREDELRETIERARQMEDSYGHYFDMVIVNSDLDRAYSELLKEVAILEREPQWVPSAWLTNQDTAPPATAGS
uniref:Putative calcium/calmodulin-dependent serine protein kinase/membrane-associated guanylate kinase n=3 Tax=Ixodes ricinus TaxID=34613 RepID=A0A6B0VGU3_IXORI